MTNSATPEALSFNPETGMLTLRGFDSFPSDVIAEYAERVKILDASDNQFSRIPSDVGKLTELEVAFLSGNPLHEVPTELAACRKLAMIGLKSCGIESFNNTALPETIKAIILTDNKLTSLPALADYKNLLKIMLTRNNLTGLPDMTSLENLELVRVSDNQLLHPPKHLAMVPTMAWIADSNNQYNRSQGISNQGWVEYDYAGVHLLETISQNHKNVVTKAQVKELGDCAIKWFGHGVDTDGSSSDEMRAILTAGNHASIIGAHGHTVDPADNRLGLVMPLIPSEYTKLADPPSFASITRDVYSETLKFESVQALNIIKSIAEGLAHLHARGVMHGDVYAHNILSNPNGDAKLGDFGAASVYDSEDPTQRWREHIDVAGYGHLVEEIACRVVSSRESANTIGLLKNIADNCTSPDATQRPLFNEIVGVLQAA